MKYSYLYEKRFTIKTDHNPLVNLIGMNNSFSRKFRLVIEEYDYLIEYEKGVNNGNSCRRIITPCILIKSVKRNELKCNDEKYGKKRERKIETIF